jgi:dTDP-4-dehydrorhamnose reductase
MNIVCLGASGLLGSFISALYPEVIPQTHENCDITSSDSIKKMFDTYQPDIIINCAGDVSRDNSNITRLFTINSFGPKLLSHYCKHDCQIIHISTNCVF